MPTAPHHVFTYAEYLERERETGLKHEFVDGQVFAMVGGTPEHARLIAAMSAALSGMVDPARCRVFSSDLKIRVGETGLATYPDVAVVCGDPAGHPDDRLAVVNPTVLVEVPSARTEAYDRGEKWAHYRRIPSLQAYVLVGQIPARLEAFEPQESGEFVHRIAETGESLDLACLGGSVGVAPLYEHRLPEPLR